ncbi:MAG: hypothetical protein K2X82_10520, partial [Gemmataceae bacterium]|nr:hypothetical protein [Gemmataceae bacterium]
MGGAVFDQGGTVAVVNSTVAGNTARGGDGGGLLPLGYVGGRGGGFGGGVFNLNGTVTLTQATFAGNAAANGAGPGSVASAGADLANWAYDVGAVTAKQTATVSVANSVLGSGGSTVSNVQSAGTATVDAPGPNLVAGTVDNSGGAAVTGVAVTTADPKLGPLQDNGGPTRTLAPLPGSPVVDAADPAAAAALLTDQRGAGFARVVGARPDLGALEDESSPTNPVLRPFSLPGGVQGVAYTAGVAVAGPAGPYTFAVTAGALPPGLTLAASATDDRAATLSGTPTGSGSFSFLLAATGPNGEAASRTYTLFMDDGPPAVAGIALAGPNPTNAGSVAYTVTFSEPVTGVDKADFAVFGFPLTGSAVTGVDGGGATYTVTVATGTLPGTASGTLRLDVVDDDTILDADGSKLGGPGAGNGTYRAGPVYTIDRTAPKVKGITRLDPSPTNRDVVRFRVEFTEPVVAADFDPADFALVPGGGVTYTAVAVAPGGTDPAVTTFDVTVSGLAGDGTLGLSVFGATATVADPAGNALAGSFIGPVYAVDRTAPAVAVTAPAGPFDGQPVPFAVVFSEPVSGFGAADVVLRGTAGGLARGVVTVANPSGDKRRYEAAVSGLTAGGTVELAVVAGAATDAAGNASLAGPGATAAVVLTPRVAGITLLNHEVTNAGEVRFAVAFTLPVTGVDAADFRLAGAGVTGASVTGVTGKGTQYVVTVGTGTGDGTLRLDVADDDTVREGGGTPLGGVGLGDGSYKLGPAYTLDRTAPAVAVGRPAPARTRAGPASFA